MPESIPQWCFEHNTTFLKILPYIIPRSFAGAFASRAEGPTASITPCEGNRLWFLAIFSSLFSSYVLVVGCMPQLPGQEINIAVFCAVTVQAWQVNA